MPKHGSELQKEACNLFDNYENNYTNQIEKLKSINFEIILDHNNVTKIKGYDNVDELKDTKCILEEMLEECYEYDDEYVDDVYKVFDMDEYYINDGGYRWWIFEFEIDEYYELVEEKLNEYNILEKYIENELNVKAGVALALLRL